MKIRKAKLKDAHDLAYLQSLLIKQHIKYDKYWKTKKGARNMFENFVKTMIRSPKAAVFVAEDNGKIVGYVLGKIEKRPPIFKIERIGHITDAFVLKSHRKMGIGKALIDELVKWYKCKKIGIAELEVDSRNDVGLRVWKKLKFDGYLIRKKRVI